MNIIPFVPPEQPMFTKSNSSSGKKLMLTPDLRVVERIMDPVCKFCKAGEVMLSN